MRVLNLTTNRAQFYELQLEALRRQSVEARTLVVPGQRRAGDDGMSSRSVLDYVRFCPGVLRESRGDYDVVHANNGLTAPAALAQRKLPVVISFWGSDLFGTYGRLGRFCARRADAAIVMSEGMADELDTDCHVIPHGVDLDVFRPFSQRAAREAVGWRQDATHVLFPYSPQRPVKDYPRAKRLVEAARRRLGEEIVLQTLSDVPHERMPLYLNAADALLLTSKWEGSPNSVKEALACNLPVLATDVGDVPTRLSGVEPSHVGETDAELLDGLLDVLDRGIPSNGRDAVRDLGVERMGERIRAVYETVL